MAISEVKQFLGAVMAALMCFALTPTMAFGETVANGNQGVIEINNAIDRKSYSIYQMLELVRFNADNNSYSYKAANTQWANFLNTDDAKEYIEVSTDGYVTWINDDATVNVTTPVRRDVAIAQFAALAIDYAKTNGIKPITTQKASGTQVRFDKLSLGYYLVDSSTGAICSLATTNPTAYIVEKNGVPTVDKQVQEDSNITDAANGFGKTNDAQIGDVVNFKSIITGQPGAVNYTLHDNMTEGLTFNPESVVVVRGESTLVKDTNYTLVTTDLVDGCTFELSLSKALCGQLGVDDQIVVTYSATLNSNAVVGGDGNKNTTTLTYGDGTTVHETPESETTTYTWTLDVFKHDESGTALAGAKFTLSLNKTGNPALNFIALGNNIYKVVAAAGEGTTAEITTDDTGAFTIQGLDADTYYLTETEAPNGFNKLDGPRTVDFSQDTNQENIVKFASVDVENKAGSLLPSTGGMGTTILYVVGAILVIGAVVFLVVRRRSKTTK